MKTSKSLKSLSRTSLVNSPSSLEATTQVSRGVQYPPLTDEIYKTFSTKNANGIALNCEEYEHDDTSSNLSTKPIMSRQASATARNKLKSKNTLLYDTINKDKLKLRHPSPSRNERMLSSKTYRNYSNNKQPIIQCTKECKKNILKNFSNYKYLNLSALDKLTSKQLEIGFLKNNPVIPIKNLSKSKRKSLEISSRNRNSLSTARRTTKRDSTKILLANINKTKQNTFMSLISRLTSNQEETCESLYKENKSRNVNKTRRNSKNNLNQEKNDYLSLKHFSIMNKFILKLVDPDEMIEDYILEGNKPFDRFTKFKKVCVREKKRICGLINDLHKAPSVNEEQIKVYLSMIKKLKK